MQTRIKSDQKIHLSKSVSIRTYKNFYSEANIIAT